MLDYHVILDLVPRIAALYFSGPLRAHVKLSGVQAALLLAIGGIGRGQEPPRFLGPLMALAVFALALRGAVALFGLLV